jgi:hypothetical protein
LSGFPERKDRMGLQDRKYVIRLDVRLEHRFPAILADKRLIFELRTLLGQGLADFPMVAERIDNSS